MSCKNIITITRQYGSGGHDIGELLSKKLGIKFYDKELISLAAKESDVSPEVFEQVDEKPTNSLLYSLSVGLYNYGNGFGSMGDLPINDKLYIAQHKVLKDLAQKEAFIVVGRCADYVLKDFPNVIKVFIHADLDVRIERALEEYDIEPARAKHAVVKADKNRANYYSFYSGQKWGQADNYDLCINTTHLTIEQAVEVILNYVKVLEEK